MHERHAWVSSAVCDGDWDEVLTAAAGAGRHAARTHDCTQVDVPITLTAGALAPAAHAAAEACSLLVRQADTHAWASVLTLPGTGPDPHRLRPADPGRPG